MTEKPPPHPLFHFWSTVINIPSVIATVIGVGAAIYFSRQSSFYGTQAEKDRELQWRPVLNVLVKTGPLDEREPLGIFLENVGKGPAQLTDFCSSRPLSDAVAPGVRRIVSTVSRGSVVAAGEQIPLLAFTPAQKPWSEDAISSVFAAVSQLQESHVQLSVCYESFYGGCSKLTRSLASGGAWAEQRVSYPCDARCCELARPSAAPSATP